MEWLSDERIKELRGYMNPDKKMIHRFVDPLETVFSDYEWKENVIDTGWLYEDYVRCIVGHKNNQKIRTHFEGDNLELHFEVKDQEGVCVEKRYKKKDLESKTPVALLKDFEEFIRDELVGTFDRHAKEAEKILDLLKYNNWV